MKTIFRFLACGSALLLSPAIQAQTTYYNVNPSVAFPASGSTWNTASDGSGTSGFSSTYSPAGNYENLVIQGLSGGSPVEAVYSNATGGDLTWGANSYTLDGGALQSRNSGYGIFEGNPAASPATVLSVTTNGFTFFNGASDSGTSGVKGDVDLALNGNTIIVKSRFSASNGTYDFGLNALGDGIIDLEFSNTSTHILFSNLSGDFTGAVLGTRFAGSVGFGAGNGAINTAVEIDRASADRFGKLDLAGDFSVRSLRIENDIIPDGVYSHADLVALSASYADNLIDNGGTVHVGQLVPGVAATFYVDNTTNDPGFPAGGSSWNTAADGGNLEGNSVTHSSGLFDLVFPSGSSMYSDADTSTGVAWDALSYTLDGGTLWARGGSSTFSGGDLSVTSSGFTILSGGTPALATDSAGGLAGSSSLQLGDNTLSLKSATSGSKGVFDFGLNVVGAGTIDLEFSNADTSFFFSNLSSDFTGTILGDTFNGAIGFATGDEALSANVVLGRTLGDRTGKLDLSGSFSLASLSIDGVAIPTGDYSHADLVALDAGYADNLVDNGGSVSVGKTVPDVSFISISSSGGQVEITFSGIIQESTNLSGWSDVTPQPSSPWLFTPAADRKFFRIKP